MMKKLAVLFLLLIFVGLATACALIGGTSADKKIEPGDKIGDFLITTGVQGNFTYGFDIQCSEPGENNTYSCNATVGEAINVSTGLYDDTGKGNLDEVWAHSNYQMFINDRPVDLPAFGTIDYTHPTMGLIRFGNVVIIASKPVEITVGDSGVFDNGDPFSSTSTYTFSAP
jgi:hypothetical protein